MDKEQINKIVNEAEAHSVKNILVIKTIINIYKNVQFIRRLQKQRRR